MTRKHLVIGTLSLAILVVLLAPIFPIEDRRSSPGAICQSRMRRLSQAFQMYVSDYDGSLPLAGNWTPAVLQYAPRDASCLACPGETELGSRPRANGYAMNQFLAGAQIGDTSANGAATTVLLFESSLNRPNAVGTGEALCNPPVHRRGNYYVFADGHVQPELGPVPINPFPRSTNP